ncbi:hypothetical protein BU23DRAFT_160528 [Bimuria novae-zelandiae CBS 107.79]|uniref:Uncharacterized protein n=1 Tax=Bimuria novae-zelandiae CBS 107.79 TaxID=1447943 RepID=A0A6A5V5R2_9PLEO|nr:hypothetical protein BU23DRAFT_160528 [Bimuria novae-zelandiae CBS 107.79]
MRGRYPSPYIYLIVYLFSCIYNYSTYTPLTLYIREICRTRLHPNRIPQHVRFSVEVRRATLHLYTYTHLAIPKLFSRARALFYSTQNIHL